MSATATTPVPSIMRTEDQVLFWGCFLALVTTAFGFIARMFLINTWAGGIRARSRPIRPARGHRHLALRRQHHRLQPAHRQDRLQGVDDASPSSATSPGPAWASARISFAEGGDKKTAYQMLYWGSLILALGNGTVEAFINPVVATHVQQSQDQVAEHPARRLARRAGRRRHGDHLHRSTSRGGLRSA